MKMMKIQRILVIICVLLMCACEQKDHNADRKEANVSRELSQTDISFWGDSTTVFVSNGLSNGYRISILKNKELCLMHFERGDSISRYCAVHELPFDFWRYVDSVGVFKVDMDFPVLNTDTLGISANPKMFFMDVNFDGEEEFLIEHHGYNRRYYACFDLVNGNNNGSCPGLLESIQDKPYNNIVGKGYALCYTVFDRKKKEIYIYEEMGGSDYFETWAKRFEEYDKSFTVKVTKQVEHEFAVDGSEYIVTYELVNDTLKKVREFRKSKQ